MENKNGFLVSNCFFLSALTATSSPAVKQGCGMLATLTETQKLSVE